MFEEAQLYSPVTQDAGGAVTVHLAGDHPGFDDPVYRERRAAIAAAALAWRAGDPVPHITYTEDEPAVSTPRSTCATTPRRSTRRSPTFATCDDATAGRLAASAHA